MNNLQTNVLKQLGYDELCDEAKSTLEDICNHGIDGGFGQFVYYSDTVKFFQDNREDIIELAKDMADQLGEDAISMIVNFNCLDDVDHMEVAEALYQDNSQNATQVQNAMAWFAAEEIARTLIDW